MAVAVNITISGATGFIGRRLAARLLEAGHSLHLLVRNPKTGFGPQVSCSVWDAKEMEPAPESLAEAEGVIHLAGEPVAQRWTPATKQAILGSRVEGTRRLIESMARNAQRPRVFICASAVGYYGSRGDQVLTEAEGAGQGFLSDVCTAWEKTADEAGALGIRVVKLRTAMVLGKEGGALAQMLTPFRWGLGGRVATGEQWMSWIHLEDLVSLIQYALTTLGLEGPLNASSPNPVTNAEFTRELARVLNRPAVMSIPAAALRLLYGEMAEVVLASQRAVPKAVLDAGFQFRYAELRPALKNLLG
jgi:uncharacterized protein (TIGR01777 family)